MDSHLIYPAVMVVLVVIFYFLVMPRLRGAAAAAPAPSREEDEAVRLARPEEKQLVLEVKAKNYGNLITSLGTLREGRWDEREFLCSLLGDHLDRSLLDGLLQRDPQQPIPYLLRGCQAVAWAWQARGHGSRSSVSKKNAELFEKRMALAEQDFLHASELDGADPTPLAFLIPLVGHLGRPASQGEKYLRQALQRDPENYRAHANYQQYFLARHWGGSYEAELAFARQVSRGARDGSDLHLTLLTAHYTPWHYEIHWGDEKQAAAYLQRPDVQEEVLAAYQRSLGSPAHQERRSTIRWRNLACWWFFMMRDRERAANEVRRIGEAYTESPWEQLGQPASQFAAVKAWALQMAPWRVVGYR